jgi:hypothetical protein
MTATEKPRYLKTPQARDRTCNPVALLLVVYTPCRVTRSTIAENYNQSRV